MADLQKLVERIERDGVITKDEVQQLNAALLEGGSIGAEDRIILNRILAKLRTGEIREE